MAFHPLREESQRPGSESRRPHQNSMFVSDAASDEEHLMVFARRVKSRERLSKENGRAFASLRLVRRCLEFSDTSSNQSWEVFAVDVSCHNFDKGTSNYGSVGAGFQDGGYMVGG